MTSQTRTRSAKRRIGSLLLAAVAAWALTVAASAQAAIVTVGSPLTGTFSPANFIGSDATLTNFVVPEPGATATSPVTGSIIRWRITQATGGPFRLRVLTPDGGTTYTGAGTSSPQTPSSTATQTFTADLPIRAGQLIGLDQTWPAQLGVQSVPGSGAVYGGWVPPLADGETGSGFTGSSDTEVGFNADVATKPSNAFSFGSLNRNKKKGTAALTVNLPGPGSLDVAGNGVKAASAVPAATVSGPGAVELLIKAKGKKKKQLNSTGKVKLSVAVTYTPTGDLPGDPNTQSTRVKLLRHP